jgi:hypothetical protein
MIIDKYEFELLQIIIMDELAWIAPKEPVWIIKNNNFVKAHIESVNADALICIL